MNKELFIQGFLDRICQKFNINQDKAFEVFSIATVVDKSFQEVYDNILIKDGRDGGIDGAMFIDHGSSYLLLLFQSKNSKGLKQNEIEKIKHDSDDIFKHGIDKPNTEDLQPKIDEYRQLSKDGYLIDIKSYFIYRGENDDPTHAANKQFFGNFNKPDDFEIWDSEELYGKINQLIKAQNNRKNIKFVFHPEPSNVVFTDKDRQGLYTYSINNVRAANFRIRATELCELIQQELSLNNTFDFLFSENIRGFLGFRPRPNKRMRDTLQDPGFAVYFPLLNNGITIICEKVDLPASPQDGIYLLPTYNPVIVNGLQTSRVIYEVYTKSKEKGENTLENVFVSIRLYETAEPQIIDKITDATNTQTPINYRDKVSNKGFSTYTKFIFESNGVAYINKRGDIFSNEMSRNLLDSIDSDTILKFWYASFYEQPETAKNSIARVLEEIYDAANNDHPLSQLFSGDKDSPIYIQLLHTYRIYRFVQAMKASKSDEFIDHINELLTYGIYKRLENKLNFTMDEKELRKAYNYGYKIIGKIVADEIQKHSDSKVFSYNGYFKKAACRYDYNRKAKITEKDSLIQELVTKK